MAGTSTTTVLRRNNKAASRAPARAVVKLRDTPVEDEAGVGDVPGAIPAKALKNLFEAEGIKSYRAQVAELNHHSSIAALSRAYDGGAVSTFLIAAVRLRFPHIPYEELFIESEEDTHEPAHAAA